MSGRRFHEHLLKLGLPQDYIHIAELALWIVADEHEAELDGGMARQLAPNRGTWTGIIDGDGEYILFGELIDAYEIERYYAAWVDNDVEAIGQ